MYILGLWGLVMFSLDVHRFTLLYSCSFFISHAYLPLFMYIDLQCLLSNFLRYLCCTMHLFCDASRRISTIYDHSFHLLYLNFWDVGDHFEYVSITYNFSFAVRFVFYYCYYFFNVSSSLILLLTFWVHVRLPTCELW